MSLQGSPRPPSWISGGPLLRGGRDGKGGRGKEGREEERRGRKGGEGKGWEGVGPQDTIQDPPLLRDAVLKLLQKPMSDAITYECDTDFGPIEYDTFYFVTTKIYSVTKSKD